MIKWQYHILGIVPVISIDLLSETTWSFVAFSVESGKTMESDGTRAARSGGLSFPTGGLACKKL
jgi:hypothetical protein